MDIAIKTRSDDLELLLTVVDSGGFTAAADVLGIQVARVSRAVSRVEQQLNMTILIRTTRRLELTEEGRQFIESIRVGLHYIQQAEEEVISHSKLPRGRLRVDAASPFLLHQLVPHISAFHQSYPDIELELNSHEGIVDLIEHRTDVAIRVGKLSDSSLHARVLGKSPLYIVASPEYLSRQGIPQQAADLMSHELIGFVGPKSLNKWPLNGINEIRGKMTSSNGEVVRQLVLEGTGIACMSGFMVKQDIKAGRLVALLEADKSQNTEREQVSAVYYKTSAIARRVTAFLDFIQPRLTL